MISTYLDDTSNNQGITRIATKFSFATAALHCRKNFIWNCFFPIYLDSKTLFFSMLRLFHYILAVTYITF